MNVTNLRFLGSVFTELVNVNVHATRDGLDEKDAAVLRKRRRNSDQIDSCDKLTANASQFRDD